MQKWVMDCHDTENQVTPIEVSANTLDMARKVAQASFAFLHPDKTLKGLGLAAVLSAG